MNYLDIVRLCLCAGDLGLRDFPPPLITFFSMLVQVGGVATVV